MAAVIVPSSINAPSRRPGAAPEQARPPLRLIDGGRAPARRAAQRVYRRRRAVALVAVVVAAAVIALAAVGARSLVTERATPSQTSAATAAAPPAAAEAYVVQPGDTLWVIARRLHPSGDVRKVVDELADRAGGPELQPGQRIDVHGLAG
jgi:LysM repeat protein